MKYLKKDNQIAKIFDDNIIKDLLDSGFVEMTESEILEYEQSEQTKLELREKQQNSLTYEQLVVSKIREKYTIDQELAILRQRDTKPQEFAEYNSYVEQCKVEAKEEVNGK